MPTEARQKGFEVIAALILLGMLHGSAALAQQNPRNFLDRLITKQYYDIALDFLDEAEKDPRTPADFKSAIPLERARTIFRSTELIAPGPAFDRRLEESASAYAKFVADQPNHPLAIEARMEMSRLLRSRARAKLNLAKTAAEPKKAELTKEGSELLKNASDQFVAIREELRKKLEPIEAKGENKATPLSADEFSLRDTLRSQYMIARSDVAESYELLADVLPAGSPERKQNLEKAAAEFKEIATKYYRYVVGEEARVSEGRCVKKLGDFPGAIKILTEVIEKAKVEGGISKEEGIRNLSLQALLEAMECWLDDSQKAYPAAIASSMQWINEIQPSEEKDPLWTHLRYLSAVAHKKFADEAKTKNAKDENAKKAMIEARKQATFVSKIESPDQAPARKLLAEMGIEVAATTPTALAALKTFEQARDAAQEAFAAAVEMPERIKIIEERLKVEMDAEQIASLKKQLEEAKAGENSGFQGAVNSYRRALILATPSTPIEEVNEVRWQLLRSFILTSKFEEAAIVGEFVARRFPTDKQAKNCAHWALQAVKKLYVAAQTEKRDLTVETARLTSIAELLTKNWPAEEEAAEALKLLIQLRISAKDYDGVVASLAQIPETSAFRAEAEAKAGQAFWAQYVNRQNELRAAANGGTVTPEAAAEQLRLKAIELLQSSQKRFAGAPPSAASIAATVSLADIFVKSNNAAQAAVLLEEPTTGPMTLIAKEETATLFDDPLAEMTCRVALAAQLALMPTSPDPAATTAKATAAMDKLSEILKKSQDGNEQRVVATYYSLAREMKQQLDLTTDPKVKANLANGAEKFLLGVRANTKDPKLLRWVAETLVGFGESFESTTGAASADSKRYFTTAAEVLDEVLKLPLEPAVQVQLQAQHASLLCDLGDYKRSYEGLLAILKDPAHRNTARFQMDAARALAKWGPSGGNQYFQMALFGTEKDPTKNENIVWGLAKISNLTRSNPQYASTFFDARYHIVLCYYGQSKKAKGEESKKLLNNAKRDLASVYKLYPQMGGADWSGKFDALLRRIQRDLGEPDKGLEGLKSAAAAPKPKKT